MVSYGLTTEEARKVWQPFLDWIAQAPTDYTLKDSPHIGSMPTRHWWDLVWREQHNNHSLVADSRPGAYPGDAWWDGDGGQVGWFVYGFESLWLPAALLARRLAGSSRQRIVRRLPPLGSRTAFQQGPRRRSRGSHRRRPDTATNPAVLDAFALAIIASGQGHAYPGLPGHEPDLPAARKEGESPLRNR